MQTTSVVPFFSQGGLGRNVKRMKFSFFNVPSNLKNKLPPGVTVLSLSDIKKSSLISVVDELPQETTRLTNTSVEVVEEKTASNNSSVEDAVAVVSNTKTEESVIAVPLETDSIIDIIDDGTDDGEEESSDDGDDYEFHSFENVDEKEVENQSRQQQLPQVGPKDILSDSTESKEEEEIIPNKNSSVDNQSDLKKKQRLLNSVLSSNTKTNTSPPSPPVENAKRKKGIIGIFTNSVKSLFGGSDNAKPEEEEEEEVVSETTLSLEPFPELPPLSSPPPPPPPPNANDLKIRIKTTEGLDQTKTSTPAKTKSSGSESKQKASFNFQDAIKQAGRLKPVKKSDSATPSKSSPSNKSPLQLSLAEAVVAKGQHGLRKTTTQNNNQKPIEEESETELQRIWRKRKEKLVGVKLVGQEYTLNLEKSFFSINNNDNLPPLLPPV